MLVKEHKTQIATLFIIINDNKIEMAPCVVNSKIIFIHIEEVLITYAAVRPSQVKIL